MAHRRIQRRYGAALIGAAVATVAALPLLGPSAGAFASSATRSVTGNSLHISGPTSNQQGMNFNETISGVANSPANYVVAWEQFYKHAGCAATFAQESTRAFFVNKYGLTTWLAKPVSPGGNYTAVAHFGAQNLGVHGMCAYLINLSTGATYAHDGIWWTNHS